MSQFDNLIQKIKEKNLELEQINKEHRAKLAEQFKELVQFFFDETPVQAIAWCQYIPYFNDGDECVFGVDEAVFILSGFDSENIPDSTYEYEEDDTVELVVFEVSDYQRTSVHYEKTVRDYDNQIEKYPDLANQCQAFQKLLSDNEDMLQEIFGSHSHVTITKDETFVNDYDHE